MTDSGLQTEDDQTHCTAIALQPGDAPSRLAVYREVVTIALPLVISTVSWTIMHFIDRVLLLGYSAEAVAAATPAGMCSYCVVCLPLGIASFSNTFVAQYFGAGREDRIGCAVWQGVFVALLAVPAVLATIPLAPAMFSWGQHSPAVFEQEIAFYQGLAWGGGAMVLAAALRSFFTGRGRVRVVMAVDSLGALTNILLDLCWIYGYCGFPRWGISGAAWSTVVSLWLEAIIYFALFMAPRFRQQFGTLRGCRFDGELFWRLLRYGTPNGLQMLIDMGALWIFLMAIGRLGDTELASTSVAFNVNGLAFMPVYGVGIATTTLVGQHLGAGRADLAGRATWAAFVIAGGYMLLLGAIYIGFPDVVMMAHWAAADQAATTESTIANVARLREWTVRLLWFVAAYSFSDAMAVIFSAALKGAGDTGFVLLMVIMMSGLLAGLSWAALAYLGWGLFGLWGILTGVLALQGFGFWLRFLGGRWRTMRVIEEPTL
jgi:MATE family multidrug resistance protein